MSRSHLGKCQYLVTAITAAVLLHSGWSAAVTTNIYEFRVQKEANSDWWVDNFSDGNPPPASPPNSAFAGTACQPTSGPGACYSINGTFPAGSESGSKLTLNSALGASTTNSLGESRLSQRVLLTTNTDSANETNGLKKNFNFAVSGIFDLVVPADNSSGYGIRLEDLASGHSPSDQVAMFLVRAPTGNVELRLQRSNFVDHTLDVVDAVAITGSEGQRVRLFLDHVAASNVVSGSYAFENGGVWGSAQTFASAATIFGTDGDLWTRASFNVFQVPVPEPESYALMLAGLGIVAWVARRKRQSKA